MALIVSAQLIQYISTIWWCYAYNEFFLLFCHLAALLLFSLNAYLVKLEIHKSVVRFYKVFWIFFFAEYLFFLFGPFYKMNPMSKVY